MNVRISSREPEAWEAKFLKEQKLFKDTLNAMMKPFAAKNGYKWGKAPGVSLNEHPALIVGGDRPCWILFEFLSLKEAKRTVPDYRHPYPIIQGVQLHATRGFPTLYVTPEYNKLSLRTVAAIKRLPKDLPAFISEVQGSKYQHSGD